MEKFIDLNWKELFNVLLADSHFLMAIGAAVFLLILWISWRRFHALINVFDTNFGYVRMSRRALISVLTTTCHAAGAKRASLNVRIKKDKIFVEVKFRLESGQNLSNMAVNIQDQISSALKKVLGIDNIGRVDVIMTGFKDYSHGVIQESSNLSEKEKNPGPIATEEDPEHIYDYNQEEKDGRSSRR